jgi:hypothetical protein
VRHGTTRLVRRARGVPQVPVDAVFEG